MSNQRVIFRASIFESIPSIIPLGATVAFLVAAVGVFMQYKEAEELPIQYTTTALLMSFAGVCFSFYVQIPPCRFLSGSLENLQETTKWIKSVWQFWKVLKVSLHNNTAQYSNMLRFSLFVFQFFTVSVRTLWICLIIKGKFQFQGLNLPFWLDFPLHSGQFVQHFPDSRACGSQWEQTSEWHKQPKLVTILLYNWPSLEVTSELLWISLWQFSVSLFFSSFFTSISLHVELVFFSTLKWFLS